MNFWDAIGIGSLALICLAFAIGWAQAVARERRERRASREEIRRARERNRNRE